jgi:hypothetical protein
VKNKAKWHGMAKYQKANENMVASALSVMAKAK